MIDRTFTMHPEFGSRRMCVWLKQNEGVDVGRKAVRRCMLEMGLEAIYPRQRTSTLSPGHKIWPYLLSDLKIERPNQVWSVDITYIPIRGAWLYLMAVMDWYSRYVLSWRLSDSLEMGFVLEAANEALSRSTPEILNSDQGSHFTSSRFTSLFLDAGSRISMDHRGRAYDNIFVERLWRTVKYEDVYPHEYATPREAREGIDQYLNWYNTKRPHQSLDYKTPEAVWSA